MHLPWSHVIHPPYLRLKTPCLTTFYQPITPLHLKALNVILEVSNGVITMARDQDNLDCHVSRIQYTIIHDSPFIFTRTLYTTPEMPLFLQKRQAGGTQEKTNPKQLVELQTKNSERKK